MTSEGHGVLLCYYFGPIPSPLPSSVFPDIKCSGSRQRLGFQPGRSEGGGEAAVVSLAFRFLPPAFAS